MIETQINLNTLQTTFLSSVFKNKEF